MFFCFLFLSAYAMQLVAGNPDRTVPTSYDCNFETGFCYWTQALNDQFDWTRHQGPTYTSNTGPWIDHTLGTRNGWYIYTEASYPRKPGDRARILSPKINDGQTRCLSFWYHMFGIHLGRLNVYSLEVGSSTLGTAIWTKNGTQGNQWKQANMTIFPQTSRSYQIVFEGVRGARFWSDIALDDIRLSTGSCSGDIVNLRLLAESIKDLQQETKALQQHNANLTEEIKNIKLENQVLIQNDKSFKQSIAKIKQQIANISGSGHRSAFCATWDTRRFIGSRIVYDKVTLNEGNVYDNNTGIFTCKNDGLYVFSWVTETKSTGTSAYLTVNGRRVYDVYPDAHSSQYDDATGVFVVKLKTGDTVNIEVFRTPGIDIQQTSFCGWNL